MNALGKSADRWRRARQRGVSPIIATILLVAITVVLAAVLYVLVSGLTHTGASTPYSLGMGTPTVSNPGGTTEWEVMALSPTTGLTTAMFGLSVLNINSIGIAAGAAPATCKATAALTFANCGAPGTAPWYVALVYLTNNTVANVFGSTGWTSGTVALSSAMELLFVSTTSYAGSGDTLNAFSTGTSSVSGAQGL